MTAPWSVLAPFTREGTAVLSVLFYLLHETGIPTWGGWRIASMWLGGLCAGRGLDWVIGKFRLGWDGR